MRGDCAGSVWIVSLGSVSGKCAENARNVRGKCAGSFLEKYFQKVSGKCAESERAAFSDPRLVREGGKEVLPEFPPSYVNVSIKVSKGTNVSGVWVNQRFGFNRWAGA